MLFFWYSFVVLTRDVLLHDEVFRQSGVFGMYTLGSVLVYREAPVRAQEEAHGRASASGGCTSPCLHCL